MPNDDVPAFREDDSWFSQAQLAELAPADHAETFPSPIPTQMVSNGEYMPYPQTDKQRRVEARIKELTHRVSRDLGITRRQFLAGTGGMAAAFLAMNEVFGEEFFKVRPEEMFEPAAFAENTVPADVFVFDDQLHTVRSSRLTTGQGLRAIAQGLPNGQNPNGLPDELGGVNTPWNPALVGLPNVAENFHLVQFIKDVYLDSQVTVGVLSNNTSSAVPDVGTSRPPKNITESELGEFLTAPQTASVRDFINRIAGSVRMLAHGQLYPGVGNQHDPLFGDYTQWQIDNLGIDSWKGYTSANSAKLDLDPNSLFQRWTLDDEAVAYPMYEIILAEQAAAQGAPGVLQHLHPQGAVDECGRGSAARIPHRHPQGRAGLAAAQLHHLPRVHPAGLLGAERAQRRAVRPDAARASRTSCGRRSSPSTARRSRTCTRSSARRSPRR